MQLRGEQTARLRLILKVVNTLATGVMFRSTLLHQLGPDNAAPGIRGYTIQVTDKYSKGTVVQRIASFKRTMVGQAIAAYTW